MLFTTLKIQELISTFLNSNFSSNFEAKDIIVQETKNEFIGDLTINVFPLTKQTGKNPMELSEIISKAALENLDFIESFEIVKGFINFLLKDSYLINIFQKSKYYENEFNFQNEKIVLEYSSPNTNKPLHLGHVRNNLLGFAVANILESAGNKVTKVNLINDRGIHICKSMLTYQKYGNDETPSSFGLKGDHLIGKYYVMFNDYFKEEVNQLLISGKYDKQEDAEKNAPLMLEAQNMLQKWEQGDEETKSLWQRMNSWVYDGFDVTYKKLGVQFDKFYYESQTYILGKEIVEEGLERNIFYKRKDGAICIDLTDEKLDEKVLLRSDGTSVYITQDLGTAQKRMEEWKGDRMIYVVGNEQEYHFKVLQLIFKKLGRPWWQNLYHLSYGMVELPNGKMKSREGTVVDADDLIDGMIQAAKEESLKLGKIQDFSESEKENLFQNIGMAALKFFILKVDPRKKMIFNPEESIELQGNTGPFILYSYTRIYSILNKIGHQIPVIESNEIQMSRFQLIPAERELLKNILKYPEIIYQSSKEYSPATLATYLYDVAKGFNSFYQNHSILNEEDSIHRAIRIQLANKTALTLKSGLSLLGINVVNKM